MANAIHSHNTGALECQKNWWGQAYAMGLKCSPTFVKRHLGVVHKLCRLSRGLCTAPYLPTIYQYLKGSSPHVPICSGGPL